jgi:hypothetical protein
MPSKANQYDWSSGYEPHTCSGPLDSSNPYVYSQEYSRIETNNARWQAKRDKEKREKADPDRIAQRKDICKAIGATFDSFGCPSGRISVASSWKNATAEQLRRYLESLDVQVSIHGSRAANTSHTDSDWNVLLRWEPANKSIWPPDAIPALEEIIETAVTLLIRTLPEGGSAIDIEWNVDSTKGWLSSPIKILVGIGVIPNPNMDSPVTQAICLVDTAVQTGRIRAADRLPLEGIAGNVDELARIATYARRRNVDAFSLFKSKKFGNL